MTAPTLVLLFALVAQGAIAMVLLAILGTIRLPLIARREVHLRDIALSREPWPESEKKVSNAFDNQFQLPVLFYLACGIALYLGVTALEAVFAVAFVLTRIGHAVVFATDNNVPRRFWAYAAGYFVLVALGVDLLVRLVIVALGGV